MAPPPEPSTASWGTCSREGHSSRRSPSSGDLATRSTPAGNCYSTSPALPTEPPYEPGPGSGGSQPASSGTPSSASRWRSTAQPFRQNITSDPLRGAGIPKRKPQSYSAPPGTATFSCFRASPTNQPTTRIRCTACWANGQQRPKPPAQCFLPFAPAPAQHHAVTTAGLAGRAERVQRQGLSAQAPGGSTRRASPSSLQMSRFPRVVRPGGIGAISMAKILFVLTGASFWTMKDGHRHPTGYWAEEFVAPYSTFIGAGHDLTVAAPSAVVQTVDM